jgi:hypothetical protein
MLTISLFSVEVKSLWRRTRGPICGFMACCLIKKHSSVWLHGLVLNKKAHAQIIFAKGFVNENSSCY